MATDNVSSNVPYVGEIKASGRVVSERLNSKGQKIITIISKNTDDVYLRFYCDPEIVPPHNFHQHMTVEGHIEPTVYKDEEKKFRLTFHFVADKIEVSRTLTEERFGVKGKFFEYPNCRVNICGVIQNVTQNKDWIKILVRIKGKNQKGASNVLISMKKLERQPVLDKGRTIYAVCNVFSPKKEVRGKMEYFEDIIVSDIAIA